MTDESTKPDVSSQDDDLALLPNLDEKILLEKLQKRYGEDVIYTYVGDILIAVNPFKSMTIYGNEVCEKYQNVKQRSKLPPHVYAIGDHMYRSMRTSLVDQVCVISGESGAGKTETAKLLVRQVLHVSRSVHPDLQAQILKVNPLLEALGNARTIMNNNSSRFGKFLKLHFNANAVVTGASIAHYLLEKSRVVTQNEGERNFHIFYLMFAGLTSEEKEKYELHEASDYKYLFNANSGNSKIANRELAQMKVFFKEVTDAMKVVGFDDEDYTNIFNLLAAILHLGQLNFTGSRGGQAEFTNKDVLLLVAQLLCLEPAELAKALTIQVTVTRGETIRKPNTIEQASEFRNSFAKFLYGHLFSWVVKSLNLMLSPSALSQAAQLLHESDTFRGTDICILDIFGFENFKVNSFEQFCINVANEQLQYYFNQHIFRWEQEEYAKEGISPPGTFVFADNKPIIELFFAKPLGMFNLLDDETKFPRASAKTLVEKFNEHCDKNTHYVKSRQSRDPAFGVKHYAGLVTYNCESFLIKNRDALSVGLLECIKTSKNDLIQAIVTETDAEGEKTNPQILLDCQSATQAMRNSRIVSKMLRSTRSRYGKPSVRKNSPPPVSVGKPALSRKSSLSRTSSTNLMEQQKPMSLTVPEEDGRSNVKLERTRSKRKLRLSMRTLRRRETVINTLKSNVRVAENSLDGAEDDDQDEGKTPTTSERSTGIAWATDDEEQECAAGSSPCTTDAAVSNDSGSNPLLHTTGTTTANPVTSDHASAHKSIASPRSQLRRHHKALLRSRTMPHLKPTPLSSSEMHMPSSSSATLKRLNHRRPSLPTISTVQYQQRHRRRSVKRKQHYGLDLTVYMDDDGRAAIKASMRKRPAKVTRKGTPTIGFYFKCSLASLMEKMLISVPHFVRCIKPNSLLVPDSFDDKLVVQQLRYTGVLETTRIRQLGYPTRLDFGTFLERYSCLQPFSQYKASRHSCPEDNQRCCVLLDSLGIKDYAIGETKVFLRYHHNETLFNLLERREQSATVLQKVVRGFLARCYFQQALVDMFCQEVKETSADLSAKLSMLMRIDEDRHQRRLEEERLERERQEQIRLQREKEEQERLQREKEEAERIERVRREKEKFVRMEQERLQRQKEEKEFQEQLQLKRQKDQEERAKAAALKKQQQQQQQLLQKEKEAQRIEKERSDQEITKVEQSDRSMPGAAAVYRRRSKVNPLERDGGDMPRTHQQQLDQMRDSTGLHDEVEKVKKEIAVVEFETEETCLAHQNILSQTEDILKEANTIRRSPVSGRSATTKSPAVVSASSPSSRVKTKRPWCVVTVMERDIVCGTYSLYPRSFTIDGSENMSASVIGINGNPPVSGHDSVNKVRPFVGKGVEIEITADGSVRAIRRSKNPVILKGRSSTLLHCHPNTELEGDVMPRNIPQEIFSASTFKQHVKDVMAKTKLDLTVLFCLCRVGIGFVRNTSNPHSTPCWAIVDFVVPHLKVNEYLQRRAVKSKRSASPWSQADIFDPRMLCFTAPMPVSSRSNYTLLQKDSDESAFTTTSPTANGSSSASAQDKTCGADALSPQYSIVNRDHSTRAHASESDAMSHTAASRTQTTGVASGRTLSSGSSLHSTTSLAPSSSGQVLSNAAATGVASNDSSPFAASRARMWAKRSKVTGSKDKA
ncbi:myosin-IIIa-like isoform X2 [Sycon ciliatum]|uniref:myosin-IIIa-like isoform X2 n=1 Tax=Sycon ciliatum TaxID=27933 RepID=UPI0031F67A1E